MSSFLDLAADRYSVRSFDSREIEPEKLRQVLEAGRVAPTACNLQPQRIKVITDEKELEELDKCTPFRFDSKTVLLVCYDKNKCWTRKFDGAKSGEVDACIAATQMMLAAHDLGLGTCWIMFFEPNDLAKAYNLPENIVPVALLPLGYPAESSVPAESHGLREPLESFLL